MKIGCRNQGQDVKINTKLVNKDVSTPFSLAFRVSVCSARPSASLPSDTPKRRVEN